MSATRSPSGCTSTPEPPTPAGGVRRVDTAAAPVVGWRDRARRTAVRGRGRSAAVAGASRLLTARVLATALLVAVLLAPSCWSRGGLDGGGPGGRGTGRGRRGARPTSSGPARPSPPRSRCSRSSPPGRRRRARPAPPPPRSPGGRPRRRPHRAPSARSPPRLPGGTATPVPSTVRPPSRRPRRRPGRATVEPTAQETGPAPARLTTTPAVRRSDIPLGSVLLALLVLAVGGLLVRTALRGTTTSPNAGDVRDPRPRAPAPRRPPRRPRRARRRRRAGEPRPDPATLDFLLALGEALVDAGDGINHVQEVLEEVAAVNGVHGVGIVVLRRRSSSPCPAAGASRPTSRRPARRACAWTRSRRCSGSSTRPGPAG